MNVPTWLQKMYKSRRSRFFQSLSNPPHCNRINWLGPPILKQAEINLNKIREVCILVFEADRRHYSRTRGLDALILERTVYSHDSLHFTYRGFNRCEPWIILGRHHRRRHHHRTFGLGRNWWTIKQTINQLKKHRCSASSFKKLAGLPLFSSCDCIDSTYFVISSFWLDCAMGVPVKYFLRK